MYIPAKMITFIGTKIRKFNVKVFEKINHRNIHALDRFVRYFIRPRQLGIEI